MMAIAATVVLIRSGKLVEGGGLVHSPRHIIINLRVYISNIVLSSVSDVLQ